MKLPKELTTTTSFSKTLAIILFILLPIVGFFLGIRYQEMINLANRQQMETNLVIPRVSTPTILAMPTIDPSITANWKTYTNPTYEFSIKYPSTLRVSSNGDFATDLVDPTINQANITTKDIKVRISVNQTPRNFDKIYAAKNNSIIVEEQHALDAKFTKINNSMTDGYKTVSYTYDVPGNQTEKSFATGIIINKNGILIQLITWETDTTAFNQILSTFKFTDQ